MRSFSVLTALMKPALDTVTVIEAVRGIGFLMNVARVTVANAFVLMKPFRFRPDGQPLPLHLTLTVAPFGTSLT